MIDSESFGDVGVNPESVRPLIAKRSRVPGTAGSLKRLRKAQRMAVSDPEIMGGTPVYRGTRVPVDMVAAMLAQGASTQEILEGYPSLKQEQVELAPLYAAAFPRRGRPARRPWAKQKPLHVARYKLAKKA
jgi:uncharacterized protein (DUF433 family)